MQRMLACCCTALHLLVHGCGYSLFSRTFRRAESASTARATHATWFVDPHACVVCGAHPPTCREGLHPWHGTR